MFIVKHNIVLVFDTACASNWRREEPTKHMVTGKTFEIIGFLLSTDIG